MTIGCDGSKNHPVFKQVNRNLVEEDGENHEKRDPGACLLSCLVALQLVAHLPDDATVVLYNNELCNSALSGITTF